MSTAVLWPGEEHRNINWNHFWAKNHSKCCKPRKFEAQMEEAGSVRRGKVGEEGGKLGGKVRNSIKGEKWEKELEQMWRKIPLVTSSLLLGHQYIAVMILIGHHIWLCSCRVWSMIITMEWYFWWWSHVVDHGTGVLMLTGSWELTSWCSSRGSSLLLVDFYTSIATTIVGGCTSCWRLQY